MGAFAMLGAYAMEGVDPGAFAQGMLWLGALEAAVAVFCMAKGRMRGAPCACTLHDELHQLVVVAVIACVALFAGAVVRPEALPSILSMIAGAASATLALLLLLGVATHFAMRLAEDAE